MWLWLPWALLGAAVLTLAGIFALAVRSRP
jgi:hypothetical protein